MKTLIRLLLLIRVFTVCHSISFSYISHCNENPNCSILGYFQYLFQVFQLLTAFECRKWLLWAVTVRLMFLLDQAGSLKIRWNLVLYARLYSHKLRCKNELIYFWVFYLKFLLSYTPSPEPSLVASIRLRAKYFINTVSRVSTFISFIFFFRVSPLVPKCLKWL